ncbi:MAG: hypothetical protein WC525_09730 [Candidatus Thermoplasmatota archaeon]
MKQFTFNAVKQFAKTCGFTLNKDGSRYSLTTPYATYNRPTLQEINYLIIRDNKRFSLARF